MGTTKQRLDQFLVKEGFASSRERAQGLINAGLVLVNEMVVQKSNTLVAEDARIRISRPLSRFVSRGGDKLDAALTHFRIDLEGVVALDVGASTGGFTDCILQRGAERVYAVDVGYNQLSLKLRKDPRVVVMEKTHAKDLHVRVFSPTPTIATVDVSFISLRKLLLPIISGLRIPFTVLVLVKPQFELGREYVEKGGVVRKPEHQHLAVKLVEDYLQERGMNIQGNFPSPLKGSRKENQEYFVCFSSSLLL